MARRIVYLIPADDPRPLEARTTVQPGSSKYYNTNTPSVKLAEAWADGAWDAADPHPCGGTKPWNGTCSWGGLAPHKTTGGDAHMVVSLEPPPTLALFTKLTFHWNFDYQQSGPNNWYLPPSNSFGPRTRFAMRNRADDGWLYPGSWFDLDALGVAGQTNCRVEQTSCGGAYVGPYDASEELLSHPEGGPFELEDLIDGQFGVNIAVDSPAFDETQGSFFYVRVFHFYLELEVQDLGGDVGSMRHAASVDNRLFRRRRSTAQIMVPDTYADRALFDVFRVAHPRGPAVGQDGWGERLLDRRALQLVSRTYWPESFRVQEEGFDVRDYQCSAWGVFRIDGAWTPELNGLCYLDQGGGFAETRAQDGWSARPGDGVLLRVLDDYPILSREGLACNGPDDVAISLRNYDPGQASWSQISFTGDTATAESTAVTMVEELGYLTSQALTFGATAGTGGFSQSLGTVQRSGDARLNVRAVVRNLQVDTPGSKFLEYALIRTGERSTVPFTEYWDATNRTWSASAVYNPIDSSAAFGELVSDGIPCDDGLSDFDPTYSHQIGRFSSSISDAEFVVALTDVQKGGAPFGFSYGTRSPLVTLDAEITRVASSFEIDNTVGPSWFVDRGMVVAELRPFFRSELFPDGQIKPIVVARHSGTDVDRLDIVRDSGANVLRFSRDWLAGLQSVEVALPELTREHVLRVWAWWLDDEGFGEYAPRTIRVGWGRYLYADDSFVDEGSALGVNQAGTVGSTDWVRLGLDDSGNYLDGWLRMFEVRATPVHDVEAIWRR